MLRLTPEIRVRIYDFLFGSTPVHIRTAENWEWDETPRHYRLLRCNHPREHVETPPRYVEWVNVPQRKRIPGCTIRNDNNGKPLCGADINLDLLLVSRQIYQEAVLKPFSEIPFYYIVHWTDKPRPGLKGLIDDLAPPQLRAFKRMRIVLEHVYFGGNNDISRTVGFGCLPDKKAVRKMTGLKDLEIVLNPQIWDEEEAHNYVKHLDKHFVPDYNTYYCSSMAWLQALPELRLNSLRVTVEAEFGEMGRSETSRRFPTFASKGQIDTIKNWLRQTELNLHFGEDVVRIQEPVLLGVKQDHDTIGVPPWATEDALKRFDLAE